MKNRIKKILKKILLIIIQFIEKIEYRNIQFKDNDNIEDKIIDTIDLSNNNLYVNTPTGYAHISEVHKTKPFYIYYIEVENGLSIQCADNHLVVGPEDNLILVKDLYVGYKIQTIYGLQKVKSIKKEPYKVSMYDISIDSNDHLFYSNGIVSHNTTTIAAFFAWYLCFHTDRNLLILANKEKTAVEIVNKVMDVFRGLPFFLKPGIINAGATGMRLDNGCQLISQATTKTASIGFTIHVLYADEFAHIAPNIVGDFWRSVYPTLSSSVISQCIITSTPSGQANLFYDIWDGAVKGRNSFKHKRVDYWEVPGHDDEWAEHMRRDFGEEFFAQEFGLQFNVDSKLLLGAKESAFLKRIEQEYVFKDLDHTDLDEELYRNLKWKKSFDPNKKYDKTTNLFVISVDTGEGKEYDETKDNDFNVLSIYQLEVKSLAQLNRLRNDEYLLKNMFRLNQVGLYRDNFKDEEIAAKVAKSIIFDQLGAEACLVVLEMNFNGKYFLNIFNNHEEFFDDIIMHTYHTKPVPGEKPPKKKAGFKIGNDKEHFCKYGRKLIREKTIIPNDNVTILEFASFGRDKKGKFKGIGTHDDTVMATLNISRLYEESILDDRIYDILEYLDDSPQKRLINYYLERSEVPNSDITDESFSALYNEDTNYISQDINDMNKIFEIGAESKNRYVIPRKYLMRKG